MSSGAESLKKPAEEVANEEPNTKRVKIAEPEAADQQDTAGDNAATNNNNNTGRTPTKALNGGSESQPSGGSSKPNPEGEGEDLEGDSADAVFDSQITNNLSEAEVIQREICNLNEKASEEILKVEQKFNKLRRPHFEKRNELLSQVPNFWLTTMANHPIISPMIDSAEEEDCLRYLVNLDVEEFDDIKSGYKLKLQFKENQYIANDVVVKQFQVISSEEVASVVSPPIEFKNTQRGQKLKQIVQESIEQQRRFHRPDQAQPSFFAWLSESTESGNDEVAEVIKDQIWPNPLEYFFAPADDNDYGTDESDDEDEEIDDEELDDEEDGIEGAEDGIEDYSDEDIGGEEDEEEDLDEEDV